MSLDLAPELGIPMVYMVDDEDVVREAVAWLLRSRRLLSEGYASGEAFEETVMAAAAPEALDWPASPCCLLLDLRMTGMSGLVLFEKLIARGLHQVMPVVFLTGHGDVPTAVDALKRGAFDFVEKPFSNNALVDRVELALRASAEVLTRRRQRAERLRGIEGLSEREREVMALIVKGLPNKLIADAMSVSVRTVETHRAHIYDKLGVSSGVELTNLLHEVEG